MGSLGLKKKYKLFPELLGVWSGRSGLVWWAVWRPVLLEKPVDSMTWPISPAPVFVFRPGLRPAGLLHESQKSAKTDGNARLEPKNGRFWGINWPIKEFDPILDAGGGRHCHRFVKLVVKNSRFQSKKWSFRWKKGRFFGKKREKRGEVQEYTPPNWPAMAGGTPSQVDNLATDPFGVPTVNGIKRERSRHKWMSTRFGPVAFFL